MGVWIETDGDGLTLNVTGVTPCVGVWIETDAWQAKVFAMMSHPAWVCGLKQRRKNCREKNCKSHPAWVCGLKPVKEQPEESKDKVTPCVGVWIETPIIFLEKLSVRRHTLRGCVD